MRLKTTFAVVLFVYSLGLTVYAQEPAGPRPKRARTAEDYQPGTLKELAEKAASGERNKEETMVVDPDLSPTRVRATYAQLTARAPERKANLIREWARRNGHKVSARGRISADITEAYNKAAAKN